ncbi:polyprenyl synthetase family protein [Companilactobacillus pabuli]|jgi:geranylgeranyl diphosphate synthase type II|uniref:Farnesyl diphosphate synthase n=1 Tax=Companilactobacillus pabuli TaxID=2714036 RepID=A0A7L7KX24_9LACO|nr:polyprenyl synthetase family protein [Companilactobacillus pabuli]AKP03674.1 farnesyl-diphosphate synthase [Companilactobacillus farciminis]AKS51979.1 farnesyl-diphosphate synthase [Companilactobacillus farciminis]MDG5112886.1 polyprenyl synthetase family protein [Companilactobacillus pabuli]QMT84340.1 polyprenyl synthetase family protein [Companilactobacillus pabuli]GAQ00536.1 farnesyl-diphosphate synthase [Companilactobacillus farciminis]
MEIKKFSDFCEQVLPDFNQFLNDRLNSEIKQETLKQAMLYSLNAGGKRVRPMLFLAVAYSSGVKLKDLPKYFDIAGAIELVHTYSLIHDDLPEMDDSDYRRGKLSNHKKFGVGPAVLAGDGLLTQAFYWIAKSSLNTDKRMAAVRILSHNAGPMGMVAGQMTDITMEDKVLSESELTTLHKEKTADLMMAAITMGAFCADHELSKNLVLYAQDVGLAFQLKDDLDDCGDGEDADKNTFPNLIGKEATETKLNELVKEAFNAVLKEDKFDKNLLVSFLDYFKE